MSEPTPTVMRASAGDRLSTIYSHPGPYASVFLRVRPSSEAGEAWAAARWMDLRRMDLRRGLIERGAPRPAIDAVDRHLAAEPPADVAAIGVVAAADGHTIVDHALDPPRCDLATVDSLPYAAPFLEWNQRGVPHVVVVVDHTGADAVSFHPDRPATSLSLDAENGSLVDEITVSIRTLRAELAVVGGDPARARALGDALTPLVGPFCNVVVELGGTADDLAVSTVRHVSDAAARSTVGFLREFRFLAEHDAAVDGMERTVSALRRRQPGVRLIHDDPDDTRRVWLGPTATDLSVEPRKGWNVSARFVDAAIRAAIASGIRVHVIPSTGATGPAGDTAHIHHGTPVIEPF